MRAVACKWGRSKGEERGSIARGGLSGDMEGYQMISGPVDCGVTSAWWCDLRVGACVRYALTAVLSVVTRCIY